MVQPLRQPAAEHRDLARVPLLEEVQYPQFVVDFAAYLVHIVSCEVDVALAQVLARSGHVLIAEKEKIEKLSKCSRGVAEK